MPPGLTSVAADGHSPDSAAPRSTAFAAPYEGQGVTVISASAMRTHAASRLPAPGRRGRFDASLTGDRPAGAFVVHDGKVRWHPALDVTRLLTSVNIVVGAVLVADRLASRPSNARAKVSMGPGGWVSMKGGTTAVRPARSVWRRMRPAPQPTRRPWWARLLAARTLQSFVA
jgi:hypothetical protein